MARIYSTSAQPEKVAFPEPRYIYRGKGLYSVNQILSGVGIGPTFSGINPNVIAEKTEIGNQVHSYIAASIQDKPRVANRVRLKADDRTRAYINSWHRWMDLVGDHECHYVEQPLYDADIGYAGTEDFFGMVELRGHTARYVVIDWKTHDPHFKDRFASMAYKKLIHKKVPWTLRRCERWIVVLTESPQAIPKLVKYTEDKYDWTVFRASCKVHDALVRKYKTGAM